MGYFFFFFFFLFMPSFFSPALSWSFSFILTRGLSKPASSSYFPSFPKQKNTSNIYRSLIHFSLPFHLLLGRSISLSLPPSFFLSSPPSLFLVKKVQVHSRFKSVSQQVFICKPFFTALHSLTFTLSFVDLTKQYFEISKQLI